MRVNHMLKEYIKLVEGRLSEFSDKERELGNFWARIVREYAEEADPLKKRLQLIKSVAGSPEDRFSDYWCKESKDYTPNEEDEDDDY